MVPREIQLIEVDCGGFVLHGGDSCSLLANASAALGGG